jgi:hypothetical protein
VFDAGALARIYVEDVSTRNLRAIVSAFPGAVYAPSFAAGEIAAAWLQFVRAGRGGDGERITWDDYNALMDHFRADVQGGVVQLLTADELTGTVLDLLEENVRRHQQDAQLPVLRAHDAYYLALARWLLEDEDRRAILVTLDRQLWVVARALGIEAFHANTCDLGTGERNVGLPGRSFPSGVNCSPCSLGGCPSRFQVDLERLPVDLDSGRPRTGRDLEESVRTGSSC